MGCQANIADSEKIGKLLEKYGCKKTNSQEGADFLFYNTCSIKQSAEDRIFGLNNKIRDLKRGSKKRGKLAPIGGVKVILTGCMIHYAKEELKKRLPSFDYFVDIKEITKLPKILNLSSCAKTTKEKKSDNHNPVTVKTGLSDISKVWDKAENKFSALIPISHGCDNFCTYCIVPYARGREESRPVKTIIKEVKEAVRNGAKEIWLLGQNVNSYCGKNSSADETDRTKSTLNSHLSGGDNDEITFSHLLRMVNAIRGDFWIRFTSPHPKDLSDDLIKAMAECEKFGHYLNLPVQSGNDEILKKMNRPYTMAHYKKLVSKIKKAMPNITLSTDIIVGFPGETRTQFKDSIKLAKEIGYEMIYIGKYSPRPKTAAAKLFKDNVPKEEKERRWREITDVLRKTALENHKKLVGKTMKVLIDSKQKDRFYGRTKEYNLVEIKKSPKLKIGEFANIKIEEAKAWKLKGEMEK